MELKTVTVLSAELPGFAELSGTLPAKDFNVLLSEIHEIADATIRLYHGVLTHFSGDTFQAVFSNEKSTAQQAQQGLETLFEFRERLETTLSEKKLPINVRFKAGIASGEATIGEIDAHGEKLISVMGLAVNFASRLGEFAEPGQTLANGSLFEATKERFDFNKLEPLPLRGSKENLSVYELMGRKLKKVIQETSSERKIGSEMVGRGYEMELIEGAVKKLLSGKGSVVNVVGKAGIGKSRLIAELKAQDWLDHAAVLEGRAQSMGYNLSFHPISQLIRSWAGIREEDSPGKSAEKLYEAIKRVAREQSEEIFPFIATMMGLPLTGKHKQRITGIEGEALEKLILKNLRDLVTLASRVRPVVIILEDLHWADNSSILFLESLFKLSSQYPVLFINIFRPGFEETGDYLLNFLKENLSDNHATILIEPLVKSDSESLIDNLLHKAPLPMEIVELILRKTEGNPFFIEEVIRSFIDEGIITIEGNAFKVTEKIHQVNIPESINEVILSRVDKLDEKTRELLKTASVIGRNFYYKVLEEAADTIGEIDDRLEYLKEVQLISESKKKEEIEYLFKHALAQQATYESIVLNSKKELHLKIARSIEKVFAGNLNEFYGTLAYHYEQCDHHEKTEEYLILSGDEAMQTAASFEAIHYYSTALNRIRNREIQVTEQQKILNTEEKLAYAFYANGQHIKAADLFNKILKNNNLSSISRYRLVSIIKVLKSLIKLRLKIRFWNKKISKNASERETQLLKIIVFNGEAIATFSPKETFFRSSILISQFPIQVLITSSYGIGAILGLSVIFPWIGRAIGYGRMLQRFASGVMDNQPLSTWLSWKYTNAMFDYFSGQLSIDSEDEKVYRLSMESGQVWAPTFYLTYKALANAEMGLDDQAKKVTDNLGKLATTLENSLSLTLYYRTQQTYLLKYRRMDEVVRNALDYIPSITDTDHKSLLLVNYCLASMACSLNHDLKEATFYYEKAEDIRKELFLKYYQSITFLARIFTEFIEIQLSDENSKTELLAKFSKNTAFLVSVSAKVNCIKTEGFRFRAISLALSGKPGKALRFFNKSIEFAQWYGARVELSRTYFELGKFLSDPHSGKRQLKGFTGKEYLEKARMMFEEMNLQWDLLEYEKTIKSL